MTNPPPRFRNNVPGVHRATKTYRGVTPLLSGVHRFTKTYRGVTPPLPGVRAHARDGRPPLTHTRAAPRLSSAIGRCGLLHRPAIQRYR